ncbi:RagB/SusD family nutrient uptake outer membrane protein [Algoriphagus sp. C2-6-M1]|uniref:RagB/SusD family nutrient uptake outer membrane protein n=1 Tax=Algoriphagus persicinus TaxID=3108754 RepID=UPI002B37B814|nr:RagB/SusD family nutrient uptake outer membrane protein [Algoriphagus sp. C2-6-M1]MEB2782174.1 RagB/SusD family nutrient uptake outer membrane protein [Algoriphagus sp. C2-6-M1]
MMKKIKVRTIILMLSGLMSCESFLDPKPDQSLVVPTTVEDIRSLLDNTTVFCRQASLPIIAGDEFYMLDGAFDGFSLLEQSVYRWADDPYQGQPVGDWSVPYKQVFYANVALDAIQKLGNNDNAEVQKLKGEALFHRAYAYFQLLQEFTPAFVPNGANGDALGLVLKENPDVTGNPGRADLESSYTQMLGDLSLSIALLPDLQLPKSRPGKAAALGLLARIYLTQFAYSEAVEAAAEALELYPEGGMNFNEINVNASRPFDRFNEETIFYSQMISYSYFYSRQVAVDSALIQSYQEGDLRLPAYFNENQPGIFNYTGKHTGNAAMFGGLTVGELQLIVAEGYVRSGDDSLAQKYLNDLIKNRIQPEFYDPVTLIGDELLEAILLERKKELIGRGIRWSDLRRLNQEAGHSTEIKRTIAGEELVIPPTSPKYVFPIPKEEIQRSGIRQNPR